MNDIIVVTGTDNGVGKTWVACALSVSLRERHNEVRAVKLVEIGAPTEASPDEDGALLARAAGQDAPTAALRRFRAALAPAAAAESEGESIDLDRMLQEVRQVAAHADVLLIEGTGGLLAPITWDCTVVDVARRLGAHAVVVAADRAGTINHTLLTLRALAEANVNCLGVALNSVGATDASTGTNAAALRRLAPGTRVVETDKTGWEQRLV